MIESIRLQNWRSHRDSTLEFRKGTNVLVGVMGSGKTSIVDAICFALFGTFPALNNRRVSIEETIMQKPQQAKSASVQVAFSYGNKAFSVERTVFSGSKSSEAKLFCENRLIAGPKPSEVTERIERELQVDFGLFSRAVYSEQNQIDAFLRLSPRERKQKFDELLQIHKYENARQNAVQLGNRIKRLGEDKKKWVLEQEQRFKQQDLEGIRRKIREKETEQKEWEQKAGTQEQKTIGIAAEIRELEKEEKLLKQCREHLLQSAGRTEELKKAIATAQKNIGNRSLEELQAGIQKILEREKQEEKKMGESEQKNEEAEQLLRKTEQELRVLESREKELEENKSQIGKLRGTCPLCQRDLAEHDKKRVQAEISQKQAELLEQAGTRKKDSRQFQELLQKNRQSLKGLQKQSEELRAERLQFEFSLRQATSIAEQQEQLEKETEKSGLLQQELGRIVFDEKKVSESRQLLLHHKTLETQALQEAKACRQLLQNFSEQLAQLEQIQDQIKETRIESGQLEKTAEKIGLFTNSLQTVQSLLRENLLEAINQAMNDIWQKAYPYSDLKTVQIQIDEGNYEIRARTRSGQWLNVDGGLSGGERSTAALCTRMAFALVLTQNLGWLILDEPTHNLDSRGVTELANLLRNVLPELVEQTFVITHDKQMEEAASGSLYEIVRDKDNEGISIPENKAFESGN